MYSHPSLSFTHPSATNQVYMDPWFNHEVTSLNFYGPNYSFENTTLNHDFSFISPSPSPLNAYTYFPNTQPEAFFNDNCNFDMTSTIQTDFNSFLPVENQQEPFFQLYESDLPYLEAFLREPINLEAQNNPCNTMFSCGESQFDHQSLHGSNYNLRYDREELQRRLKFKCGECGMGFPTSNALGGHMSYHSKIRKKEALRIKKFKRQAKVGATMASRMK